MRTRRRLIAAAAAALLLVALTPFAVQRWLTPAEAALGDASCDGQVNAVDATVILQLTAGLIASIGCPQNADTDGSGSVGPVDATLILQFVAGLIPDLGPPATPTPTPTRTSTQTTTPSPTSAPSATTTPGASPTDTATAGPTATGTTAATNTATATPAASATATFTPTRTPTPLSTVHVRNSSWYVDGTFSAITVLGEVYNGTGQAVAFINVNATAYSATGEILAQTEAPFPTCVSSVAAHTDTPFQLDLAVPDPNAIDHVVATVATDEEFGYVTLPDADFDPPVAGVTINNLDSVRDTPDTQHVSGEVVNQSNHVYDAPIVCLALYDSTNAVIRADYFFTEDDPLGGYSSTTFDAFIDVTGIPEENIASTRAWFDAIYE